MVSLVNVIITARYLGPTGRGDIALLYDRLGTDRDARAMLGVEQATVNIGGREPRRRPPWRQTR